jgi:cytochrome c553
MGIFPIPTPPFTKVQHCKSPKHQGGFWFMLALPFMRLSPLVHSAIAALALVEARAAAPEQIEFFEKQVRPVLVDQCYKCHGSEKQKGGLRMDSREALLKGGDDGAVVVPGKPEESSLIKSINHIGDSKMPEKADKLPDAQIAALSEWVKMGIPWPENDKAATTSAEAAAKTHWAFKPIANPAPPEIQNSKFKIQNPLDAFLLAKLEPAGLSFAPAVDKRTLLRRATFDLTGLPPTTEEVAAFENDAAPDAFAKVLDRLLASPRYGERWGRYWLDVARYADSKGYVFTEERKYPFAYTFRDWVVRAFNEDMPYDRFVIDQLAADFIAPKDNPADLAAMGFLTVGRRFLNNPHDIIDDRIDLISRGLMGLTIACARCHDHKFDPISQKDYYALYGVFASSNEPAELPLIPNGETNEDTKKYEAELAERRAALDRFYAVKAVDFTVSATLGTGLPLIFAPLDRDAMKGLINGADRDRIRELRNHIEQLNATAGAPARAMVMLDNPAPVEPRVFVRGSPDRPGETVHRQFVSVLSGGNPTPFTQGSGRLELGRAIASRDNPLTARVFVNRVWAHHFGRGLVRTPGDFGTRGDAPTHPELLDWLATKFMDEGWSVKKLHRLIMLSAAYQQSSDTRPEADKADPENRLLTHQNRQRLDFEAMRDSLLSVAGALDPKMGGQPIDLAKSTAKRRTIYGFIDRQNLPGIFRTFDFASPDTTSAQRFVTTVPQQALFMMNNPFAVEQARTLVARPDFAADQGASEWQVQQLYERVFARHAEPAEVESALRFVAAESTRTGEPPMWQCGYGFYDAAAKSVQFTRLPHFSGNTWQGGPKVPDNPLGYTLLNDQGGHTGSDAQHATIRRWTAPRDTVVAITGTLARPSEAGDGVEAWIVSSRAGEILHTIAEPKTTAPTNVEHVEVKAGDTLDFIVSCRADNNSDSFQWAPVMRGDGVEWSTQSQFPKPLPPTLTPWEKLAQVLLSTNEFVFVD